MSTTGATVHTTNAVSLADEEEVKQVLLNSVLGLWDVVNDLTRLRPSRQDRYRVTIFGSARAQAGTFGYEETKRAAAALAEMGCDIITGGGPSIQSRNAVCCAWAFWPIVFPLCSLNGEGQLVGFNVEMAQLLAGDLGVKVEFIEMEDLKALPRLLATGRIDLAMPGVAVTPERAVEMLFSEPYLDETLAFVVKDQLREEFSNWATIRGPRRVSCGGS